jgi:hypothetical protein
LSLFSAFFVLHFAVTTFLFFPISDEQISSCEANSFLSSQQTFCIFWILGFIRVFKTAYYQSPSSARRIHSTVSFCLRAILTLSSQPRVFFRAVSGLKISHYNFVWISLLFHRCHVLQLYFFQACFFLSFYLIFFIFFHLLYVFVLPHYQHLPPFFLVISPLLFVFSFYYFLDIFHPLLSFFTFFVFLFLMEFVDTFLSPPLTLFCFSAFFYILFFMPVTLHFSSSLCLYLTPRNYTF